MLEIGLQIKRLREERCLTGKDLARRIGLSQSQMSRLEKGHRRIDTEMLSKIADALDVPPGAFFGGESPPESREKGGHGDKNSVRVHPELGRLIRSERRQRHLTVEDLARKTGFTKAYVLAVEEGRRRGTDDEFLRKVCRTLGIDPFTVLRIHEQTLEELNVRLNRLLRPTPPASPVSLGPHSTPILVGDESLYPAEFDGAQNPVAAVEEYMVLPTLRGRPTFAVRVMEDAMNRGDPPTFQRGDLVVFATDRRAESGEDAFVRYGQDETTFRRVFFDDDSLCRLQALRPEVPPRLLPARELRSAWPLVAHVRLCDDYPG